MIVFLIKGQCSLSSGVLASPCSALPPWIQNSQNWDFWRMFCHSVSPGIVSDKLDLKIWTYEEFFLVQKNIFGSDRSSGSHSVCLSVCLLGWSEKRVKSFYSIVRCASTSLIILWLIHVNFGCISFSVIMKVFVIFWVFNLRRLTALSWCLWLEHMFYYFNCRWQHQVTKGGYSNLHVAT